MTSLRSNILLNGINTVTSVLFPIITFPYAARVLLPEGIGTINFLNGIVSYLVLITSLGIPMYAVREIARVRNNISARNKTALEIFSLQILLCIVGYILVWLLASFVEEIRAHATIFYVLSLSIIFTAIGVNWFYEAIEDFRFITIRAVIIRTLAAASLFIFVHTPADLLAYSIIIVGSTVGNNILNFFHLRTHISIAPKEIVRLASPEVFRHLKPALMVFSISVVSSIYLSLNSIMLGFLSCEEEVGYFTAASRITQISITVICSVSTVLLPRVSNLISSGQTDEFKRLTSKSLLFSLMFSLPIVLGLIILSSAIMGVFCGPDYLPAINVLILNAPTVLFSALSVVTGFQILYPLGKTHIVVWSACGGAVVNLLLNFYLIPSFGSSGAAFSTTLAEAVVLTIQLICGRKYFPFRIDILLHPTYYVATAIMAFAIYPFGELLPLSDIVRLILAPITGCIVYFISLLLMRDSSAQNILSQISSKLLRR